jgi:hypothetical protein
MRYLKIQNSESEGSTGAHVHQIPSPANFLVYLSVELYGAQFLKLENVI